MSGAYASIPVRAKFGSDAGSFIKYYRKLFGFHFIMRQDVAAVQSASRYGGSASGYVIAQARARFASALGLEMKSVELIPNKMAGKHEAELRGKRPSSPEYYISDFKTACMPAFTVVSILASMGSLPPWLDRCTSQLIPPKTPLLAAQGYRGFTVHQAMEN